MGTMSMDNSYIAPTISTTQAPSAKVEESTTSKPSIAPTLAIHIHEVTEKQGEIPQDSAINSNGAFHVSWMIWTISACVIVWGLCCIVFYAKKKRSEKKKGKVDFKGVNSSVYGISSPASEDINLSMVQMDQFRYGAGTIGSATGTGTKGKGEIIAMDDSDATSGDDDDDAFLDDDEEDNELYGKPKKPTKGGHQKRK